MIKEAKQNLIVIAGLGDHLQVVDNFYACVKEKFTDKGFNTRIFRPKWNEPRHVFDLLDEVACLTTDEMTGSTSMMGLSLGGGLALATLADAPHDYNKVVAVSSRTNLKKVIGTPEIDVFRNRSLTGANLVSLLSINLHRLPLDHIMTVLPDQGDEQVSHISCEIEGATHKRFPIRTKNHAYGIAEIVTSDDGVQTIVDFLRS